MPPRPTLWNSERPLILAHRGASAYAPENTLAAFRLAAEMGADGVELDVRLSADGVPVVIHDATVGRTTDGYGTVSQLTLTELQALDAGSWFSPDFAGQRLPTLQEVLEVLGDRLLFNVELKGSSWRDRGLEAAVLAVIEAQGMLDRVLISSFDPFALRRMKRLAPRLPVALLYAPDLPLYLRRAWLAPLLPHEVRNPEHTMVTPKAMAWFRRHRYRVVTWTVDEPEEMRRLARLGVDGIITNRPDVARRVLAPSPEATP